MDVARVAETGLWRLPPPAPCRVCGPQARSTTTAGGRLRCSGHIPGGRRPLGPANGGVTEDRGQVILRIKEDLRNLRSYMCRIVCVGEVGGMPKLGQNRKSRLRRHGKEWKKSVHGDLKL